MEATHSGQGRGPGLKGLSPHCSLHPACSAFPVPLTGISFILQDSAPNRMDCPCLVSLSAEVRVVGSEEPPQSLAESWALARP